MGQVGIGLRVGLGIAALFALLFGCAGRWDLPFIWAYIIVLVGATVVSIPLLDPGLIRERTFPPPGGLDRSLRFVVLPFFLVHLVIAALDVGRFQWSGSVTPAVQVACLAGLAASRALSIWAAHVNRFFSPVVRIQSDRGHHLVSDGPYRWIRHPGYTAAAASMLCSGPAIGSWWAVLTLVPVLILILRRTIIEDRYLPERLEGYAEYAQRVRYRLVPGVW
jgi:protein-S-isoprenylcysteine O-methyltransferase Ste14